VHLLAVLSLKNRALIALVTIVVAVFGALALTGLRQELAPSIQFPQLVVVSQYPGASPEVVNNDVSTPIETAVQAVPNIDSTTARSSTGVSVVTASFSYGTDLNVAEEKMTQAVARLSSVLPSGVQPQVIAGSIDDFPILQIAVTGGGDQAQLADLLTRVGLGEIKDVTGVRDAQLVGAVGNRVTITPDRAALALHGLQPSAIGTALSANGVLVPAGTISQDGLNYSVQAGQRISSVDDIKALPLVGAQNGAVTIGDVATVAVTQDPVTSLSQVNGKPSLSISVTKLPSANTVEVANAVKDMLPGLASSLGNDVQFTVVFDQAPFIEQSISSLAEEGLLGLAFAVIVILVFLLSIRSTIVTAISIPTSVLITFIGLQAAGYTLNILTLGALTIAIGRVVDDSIVVIENINRHLVPGANKAETIVYAVKEVAAAITASTITTVAVFLPLAFVSDITGELFRPFALTVTIALLASLVVALTIVPVLAYWFLRPRKLRQAAAVQEPAAAQEAAAEQEPAAAQEAAAEQEAPPEREPASAHAEVLAPGTAVAGPPTPAGGAPVLTREPLSRRARTEALMLEADAEEPPSRLQRAYAPVVRWSLKRPLVVVLLAVIVLAGTLGLSRFMKTNFLGGGGQNTLTITQTLDPGTSLDVQAQHAQAVEQALLGVPGVDVVQASIGSSGSALRDAFAGSSDGSITYSVTTDPNADQDALQAKVRETLGGLQDQGSIALASSSGFGSSNDIEVDITAGSQDELQAASGAIVSALQDSGAFSQVESNLASSRPYVAVRVDRGAAAAAGFTEAALSGLVAQLMRPSTIGQIELDDSTLSVYLDLGGAPTTVDQLRALTIPTAAGPVALSTLATVEVTDGPVSITTVKGLRSATVSATPAGSDLSRANSAVSQALDTVSLPAGASAELGGVTADQGTAFQQLGIALLAAILIVYIVMVATFKSLRQPLLLLVSVPFAATGAILLQVVTGIPLGVASLVGVLMLVGIVVTNAIVLVDLVNQYRRRGASAYDAIVRGASRRLRPILMTALATIFALLPMAVGLTGQGGFISQPLALVVIGGLVSSTVLTLIVLPALYYLVEGAKERRQARRAARAQASPQGPEGAQSPAQPASV